MSHRDSSLQPTSGRPLVILGASVRALAESAQRAGWAVHAADLFGDLDLAAAAREVVAVGAENAASGYPESLRTAAEGFPTTAPWCYTGAIENYPDLIDAIAATRPLAGNSGQIVKNLRDPAKLAAAGLAIPETRAAADGVPVDGTFLVKPLASGGGRGIHRWTPEVRARYTSLHEEGSPPRHVWQRLVAGTPASACYCVSAAGAELVGTSSQLIGEPWCHAGDFSWCGAVAELPLESTGFHDRHVQLERLGRILADQFHPIGLIGVDLVIDTSGHLHVIEVNPRPTASMELFERMGRVSIAGRHLEACGYVADADPPRAHAVPRVLPRALPGVWAKAVLFMERATPVSDQLVDALISTATAWTQADGGWPALADIPRPGQTIAAGAPVVTIFAAAPTTDDALNRLRDRVARIDALLSARV